MEHDDSQRALVLLQQAIAALRTQDHQTARSLLAQAISLNPKHDQLWLWLSGVVTNTSERRYCLEQALALNPQLTIARRSLERLPPGEATIPSLLTRPHSHSSDALSSGTATQRPVPHHTPNREPFIPVALSSASAQKRATQTRIPAPTETAKQSGEPATAAANSQPPKPLATAAPKKPVANRRTSSALPGLEGIVVAKPPKRNWVVTGGIVAGVVATLVVVAVIIFPQRSRPHPTTSEGIADQHGNPAPPILVGAISPSSMSTPTLSMPPETLVPSEPINPTEAHLESVEQIRETTLTTVPTEPPQPTLTAAPTEPPQPTLTTVPTEPPQPTITLQLTAAPDAPPTEVVGYVINGGNMRSEPLVTPATVIGQICPGDQLRILAQQTGWVRFVVSKIAADCAPQRVRPNTEGWAASSLIRQVVGQHPADDLELPSSLPVAVVVEVESGAVLGVTIGGQRQRVRLIGIDAPAPSACFGPQSIAAVRSLLQEVGAEFPFVLLEADETLGDTDPSGALLRYVWLPNGKLLNAELLRLGQARLTDLESAYAYQDRFERFAATARQREEGWWKPGVCP